MFSQKKLFELTDPVYAQKKWSGYSTVSVKAGV